MNLFCMLKKPDTNQHSQSLSLMFLLTASACYNYTQEGVMIAAAGDAIWNNGAACGKFVTVKCTGPRNLAPPPCTNENVTVKIIDHCPGCPFTLDLSKEAFTKIANPMGGIINIDYYL
ncbi:putative rlpA-like protein, double-psi beta-barrel [Rosa chinensis]|uniref:Putative rlpA-like protein, double-psi beta-barrel n=1 Tax=Rosa chinensis TaxID=74649 RepID=A0A2P6QTY9_ROSCH|nr:putative rlpA-like protein, double-psi beta-barrel [Rosa chinensis]